MVASEAISNLPELIDVKGALAILDARLPDSNITYHQFIGWIHRDWYGLGKNSTKVGHGIVIIKSHMDSVIEELKKLKAT